MTEITDNWPNFLIVGTARSGTTSVHEVLGNHRDIFMPLQKEPTFFTFYGNQPSFKDSRNKYITTKEEYLKLFEGHNEKIKGESSTPYLYLYEQTLKNIQQLVPDAAEIRILIILRDPSERAYSQYMHNRRDLREELSFTDALSQEKERKNQNWHFDFFYADKGFYYGQVKAYLDYFKNVKITFYDLLEKNPKKFYKEIYEFLGVEQEINPSKMVKRNQSGEMKVKWMKKIITTRKNPVLNFFRKLMNRETKKKLRNWTKDKLLRYNLKKSEMDPVERKQLIEIYRQDILQLQKLINKDLSEWLKV